MKKVLFVLLLFSLSSCEIDNVSNPTLNCGIYNGKQLILGSKGGCYYINSNNNKTYVERSLCKC
jgi:hypothetical protein